MSKGICAFDTRESGPVISRDWPLAADSFYSSTASMLPSETPRCWLTLVSFLGIKGGSAPLLLSLSFLSPQRVNPTSSTPDTASFVSSSMSKCRTIKKKLPSQQRTTPEKPPRVVKSKKSIWPVPSKVFQRIHIRQPLSGDEAEAIFALRSLLQKKKRVVVISGAGISVNAGSKSPLVFRSPQV